MELRPRVHRCFEAGGLATGAKVEFKGGDKPYAEMRHDDDDGVVLSRELGGAGTVVSESGRVGDAADRVDGHGNVSLAMPSIHPMIGINSLPAVNHQPEFTAHCVTPDADKALIDGALAMAWTCIDLASIRNRRRLPAN